MTPWSTWVGAGSGRCWLCLDPCGDAWTFCDAGCHVAFMMLPNLSTGRIPPQLIARGLLWG